MPYTLVHVSNGAASDSSYISYSHRSAAESWTDKEGYTTLLYTVSCVAVAASPICRSLLTETANSEQLLSYGHGSVAHCFVSGRSYGLILATVCGLDYWFACYYIHRYVALSVIGQSMCNRISGLCDKSSITIDTKRYLETSLVCCLRYYYSCCALVIIWGNQLVIFPGIALLLW